MSVVVDQLAGASVSISYFSPVCLSVSSQGANRPVEKYANSSAVTSCNECVQTQRQRGNRTGGRRIGALPTRIRMGVRQKCVLHLSLLGSWCPFLHSRQGRECLF